MGADYLEDLVLKEVRNRMSKVQLPPSLRADAFELFSTLTYFPLQISSSDCLVSDFYSVASFCTTRSLPRTFDGVRFSDAYASILGNTLFAPLDQATPFLVSASQRLVGSRTAAVEASPTNGGVCVHAGAATFQAPGYRVDWLDNGNVPQDPMSFDVNIWRKDPQDQWKPIGTVPPPEGAETLHAELIYEHFKLATILPETYDSSSQIGWYDSWILSGIRNGELVDDQTGSVVIVNQSSLQPEGLTQLRRAAVFLLVGSVTFRMKNIGISRQGDLFGENSTFPSMLGLNSESLSPGMPSVRSDSRKAIESDLLQSIVHGLGEQNRSALGLDVLRELSTYPHVSMIQPILNGFQLTQHLRIPNARILTEAQAVEPVQPMGTAMVQGEDSSSVTSEWVSGNLFDQIQAGYILAVIEDCPLG